MEIDSQRLKNDLLSNAKFGVIDGTGHGRTVLTGSEADKKARDRLVRILEQLGMDVLIDPVGNIVGRWLPSGADPNLAPVVAGSHLDSVPNGGMFDGPLGVYAAIEAIRAMQASERNIDRPIQVVSFTEEEGQRFGKGVLGSSVVSGERSVSQALQMTDDQGRTLESYLEQIGYQGDESVDASEWHAFFETHIEQSSRLDESDASIGIVHTITGVTNCRVTVEGESNHAGGTLMKHRNDSLLAAAAFIQAVNEIALDVAEHERQTAVGTVGEIDVNPNTRNVIAGKTVLNTDFRDIEHRILDEFVRRSRQRLGKIDQTYGVESNLERYRTLEPAEMSKMCMRAIQTACSEHNVDMMNLHSAGGHDAMNISKVTDAGMIFTPSKDGISHSPLEWTDWVDCQNAALVLAEAIVGLASK